MNLVEYYLTHNNLYWIRNNVKLYDFHTGQAQNIIPSNQQLQYLQDKSLYKFIIHGRRVGMTTAMIADAMQKVCNTPNRECLILTAYSRATECLRHMAFDMIELSPVIRNTFEDVDRNSLMFNNGSVLKFRYMGRIEDVNINTPNDVYFDQCFRLRDSLLYDLTNRLKQRSDVSMTFATTPDHDSDENIFDSFTFFRFPATESSIVSPETIARMYEEIPTELFRREVLAQY
jgi:hypothetical protein